VPPLDEGEGEIMMTPTEGRERGNKRASRGIKRAAFKHRPEIEDGTLKFLDALLASATGCATLDDATDDLRRKHADGGKWRGNIPKRLKADGLIVADAVVKSCRLHRNAGYVTSWRLLARSAAERRRAEILAAQAFDNPPKDAGESAVTDSPAVNSSINPQAIGEKDHGTTV